MDKREVTHACLVEACGDSAEALEAVEEEFNEIALTVESPVFGDCAFPLGLRADDGLDASRLELGAELVRVIAGVSDQRVTSGVVEEFWCCDQFVALARR
jgi:hypothetical protein